MLPPPTIWPIIIITTKPASPPEADATHCSLSVIRQLSEADVEIMSSPNKSCTFDPVPAFLLREFVDVLLPYVTHQVGSGLIRSEILEVYFFVCWKTYTENLKFVHVNSSLQCSVHNVLFCSSLCILLVHVTFTRLCILSAQCTSSIGQIIKSVCVSVSQSVSLSHKTS